MQLQYQNKRNTKRANKSIDDKNIKSNMIKDNFISGMRRNIHLNNLKKEIIAKNNEEYNWITQKTGRILKQKSIDNIRYKNIMNNNNKHYIQNQKRQIKLPSNQQMNTNNIYPSKNSTMKKNSKRQLSIDSKNIKNIPTKKNNKIPTKLSNPFMARSYLNYQNERTASNDIYSETKESFYEKEITKQYNKNVLTTFVQIEDLTKIPDRIGGRQNKYAEYDYNEAKRAAITCRRIEYSYNLRNVIKGEICLDEVIIIQRWWRKILRQRYEEMMKELENFEKINANNIQRYILFLNKIHYIYVVHLLSEFIKKLKSKYGKLYYKNYFNNNAIKIQRAFREYLSKKFYEKQKKLEEFLRRLFYKKKKREFLNRLKECGNIINQIKFLQNYIKYYLLRHNFNYRLKCAHEIHPFMYFLLKYKIPFNKKSIIRYKRKRKRFLIFVEKWINFHKYKKMIKYMMFLENIQFIIKKKFFIFFFLRLVERINAMITYFLLQPLMKDILQNYYLRKVKIFFNIWKINDNKMKERNNLAKNLIAKIVKIFTINSLIKKINESKKEV